MASSLVSNMNTHLPAPASPNVFSSYSSLLVGHLSLCIHHPNPLPSSVIHPQFRHTYIAHHAHRSLFFPFCFISNRIFLVIATLYTFPPPWRHPFPVWYSRNPFFFCIQRGLPSSLFHIFALLPPPPCAFGAVHVLFAWFSLLRP